MTDKNKYLLALKHALGFVQEPPTIDEALDSSYYLKNIFPIVYPFWRERLRELFPDNITTTSSWVALTGSIGGGKSTFSQIVLLYDLIKLSCLRDVEEVANLTAAQGFFIKISNVYKHKAEDFASTVSNAVFGGVSPFFQNELDRGNKFLKKLKINAVGSREKDIVSNDVIGFHLSEINELPPDKALSLVASAASRLTSRFLSLENLFVHLIVDSSTKGTDAATERLLRTDAKFSSSSAFVVRVNSWNTTRGLHRYFNYGSFWVYCGDAKTNPFIVPKNFSDEERRKCDPDRFIECPNELLPEAERDIVLFLQEKAGIATSTSLKFFSDNVRLMKAFKLEQFVDDVIRVDFFDPYDTIMEKLAKDVARLPTDRKLYVKLDCGLKSDLFGISIAYGDGIERNTVDGADVDRLKIRVPISFALSRYNGQETPINKVEDFILQLSQTHDVAMVLTDQYQSSEIRQIMIQNGVPSKLQSVDRTDGPYIILKNYIYSGLVELVDNAILRRELSELEHVDNRVDHPVSGGKDTADTVCGLVSYMVECGPEDVLSPPESKIVEGITDIYTQLRDYHKAPQPSHSSAVSFGSFYDYI